MEISQTTLNVLKFGKLDLPRKNSVMSTPLFILVFCQDVRSFTFQNNFVLTDGTFWDYSYSDIIQVSCPIGYQNPITTQPFVTLTTNYICDPNGNWVLHRDSIAMDCKNIVNESK